MSNIENRTTILELWRMYAVTNPDQIAVIHEQKLITYRTLNKRSNQLAHYLKNRGVQKDVLVPVFLEHSIDVIVAIIGIMKAGGAYVPIDTEYPADRISYMLEDTGCRIVLSSAASTPKLSKGEYKTILVDDHWSLIAEEPDGEPPSAISANDLAYVIYTSGSTGKPKGVMVEHAQLYSYIVDICYRFKLSECNSFAIFGTFAADAGYTAVFAALCFGKQLSIINIKNISRFEALVSFFQKFPVDCYKMTPSLLQFFLQHKDVYKILPRKSLILGGEPCSWELANSVIKILPAGCSLFNHYGPTETTVGVITYSFPLNIVEFPDVIPLGKPLPNVQVHILNERMERVENGQIGELYIEGPLVARGYLNNSLLTDERFICQTYLGENRRLYKTGDVVRYLKDGNIEYLGRVDDQVKILGNRIEIKEIEHAILQSGMVKQCIVVVKENKQGMKYLAGYVLSGTKFNKVDLMKAIKAKLPGYMIPSRLMVLQEWPLTFNNKIDKKALPDPDDESDHGFRESKAIGMEADVLEIWQALLGINDIQLQSNFFELGGDSLLLVKLSFEISVRLHMDVSAVELFGYLTIEEQAAYLLQKQNAFPISEDPLEGFNEKEVSVTQRNLFFQNKLNPSLAFPNSSITFKITGEIDINRLEWAFKKIIHTHESLMTKFLFSKGTVQKSISNDFNFKLEVIHARDTDIDREIIAVTKPFDFGVPPLIRVFLIVLTDTRKFLHIDLPHINSDGESIKIIMQDLEEIYTTNKYRERPRLQFTDFQKNAHIYLSSPQYKLDKQFWQEQLSDGISFLNFNTKDRNVKSKYDGAYVVSTFTEDMTVEINKYVKNNAITKFQFLLTAYFLLLHKVTNASNFGVMLPVRNRIKKSMEDIIGLLSNVVIIKADINPDLQIKDFVVNCRERILKAIHHQQFPFEKQLALWNDQGKDIKNLFGSFFGHHYNRDKYRFDAALLELYIPLRDKENLPLSMAVFETETGLIARYSSTANVFDQSELKDISKLYSNILRLIINSCDKDTIGSLLSPQVLASV